MTQESLKKNLIKITEAPDIDGLSFRSFQGEADFAIMLDLINRAKVVDQIERSDTLDDLKRSIEHMDHFDPVKDMLFAEVAGETIAYGQAWWHKEIDGPYIHKIRAVIVPEWRRQGLGTALSRYLEARHREIVKEQNLSEATGGSFEVYLSDTEVALLALMEKEGYKPERFIIEMTRPCSAPVPEAVLPEGLEVRPVEEPHIRPIYAAEDEAFRDHWGHRPITENNIQEWISDPDFDPSLWKVAWDGDQVAGMVLNFVAKKKNEEYQRQRGYTEDICVRRPWRKRGLAKALLAQSIHMFTDMGMQETTLGVDVQNPNGALGLYEGMGYKQIKQYIIYRKPMR